MNDVGELMDRLPGIPIEYLLVLICFAAIGLSIFALYVVHSVIKGRRR
jgi:hypothetical protein